DEGLAHFAQPFVGYADDGDLGDGRVAGQDVFDFCRVAVETAGDVHVLEPIRDADVAALVQVADVAGVHPAVRFDGLGRGLGVVQVFDHDVVAPHLDFTRLACRKHFPGSRIDDANLGVGDRFTDRADDGFHGIVRAAHGNGAAGFGLPIGGEDDVKAQFIANALNQCRCGGRRAGDG